MHTYSVRNGRGARITALLVAAGLSAGLVIAAPADDRQAERLAALRTHARQASLVVHPVELAGSLSSRVGEVLGIFMERAGMQNVDTTTDEFAPPADSDLPAVAAAFAEHVKAKPPTTDYALFAQFVGSPAEGLKIARGIVVTRAGEIVWTDEQKAGDADFDRLHPREPMTCCQLLAGRLREALALDDPLRADAPKGKLSERLERRSGVPTAEERRALESAFAEFKQRAAEATLTVYQVRVNDELDKEATEQLVAALGAAGRLSKVATAEKPLVLDVVHDMNEQKVLWSLARDLRTALQKHPAAPDYVLYAHYLMGPKPGQVHAVHFVICTGGGDWVLVDFQNDHHADFQRIDPQSTEDCARLVAERLVAALK